MEKKQKYLRIAQVAPLWYNIPPQKYGGVERIVALLTDELVKRGHKVTLFAPPGSRTKAQKLVSVYPKPLISAGISWTNSTWNLRNLSLAVQMAQQGAFDIIHTHIDLLPAFFNELTKVPLLITLHSGIYSNPKANDYYNSRYKLFKELRKNLSVVFLSKALKQKVGFNFKKNWVVYNGIDLKKFHFNKKPKDYFVWVSRIEKKKGVENAIKAAQLTKSKLLLAGRLDEETGAQEYFKKKIKPKLNKNIKYLGELNQKELSNLYGSAKALLYPIEWEEPFGLVMAEAMACGTPVIVYNMGAAQEVVKNNKTGFVIKAGDVKSFVTAMKKVNEIDREDCRKRVENLFSKEKMTENYLAVYKELINTRP